jgi:uncharacterized protein YegL
MYTRKRHLLRILLVLCLVLALVSGGALPVAADGPCPSLAATLIVDRTGSMGGAIDSVRQELIQILDDLEVVSSGTYWGSLVLVSDTVTVAEPLTSGNRAALEQKIRALTASGGDNEPEASDEAINTVVNVLPAADRQQVGDFMPGFPPEATKVIILITDARPGGFDDIYVGGVHDQHAREHAREAAAAGIRINSVFVPTNRLTDINQVARKVMRGYAATTGGRFIQTAPDGHGTGAALRDILRSCGAATGIDRLFLLGGEEVASILDATLDIASVFLPWIFALLILLAALGVPTFMFAFILGLVIARNWVMHAINNWHRWLATGSSAASRQLKQWNQDLDAHIKAALETWPDWAQPERKPDDNGAVPIKPGPYHGWELLSWLPPLLLLVLCSVADLIFLGLGATFLLGLTLAEQPTDPFAFGLSLEAVLVGLSILAPGIVFFATICAITGPSADVARPWGNTSPIVRRRVRWGCWLGVVIWAIGVITFALYRADLIVADFAGATLTGRFLLVRLPYVFVPIFALTLACASGLVFWSVLVGMNALYILGALFLRRLLGVLHFLARSLTDGLESFDRWVISCWDAICKGFTTWWNARARADKKLFGLPMEEIFYCEREPVNLRREDDLGQIEGTVKVVYACYCTPRPKAGVGHEEQPGPLRSVEEAA